MISGFIELIKGLGITLRHCFKPAFTRQYPEVPPIRFERTRAIHKLHRYADGMERCIGCGLCARVCPSDAIFLEAKENTDEERFSPGERYCVIYDINMIRCIFCGYCEEACPEDAIRLHQEFNPGDDQREKLVYTKEDLLQKPDEGDGEHFLYYNRNKP